MKRTALTFVALAILLAILLPVDGGGAGAGDSKTLTGEYVWNQGGRGKLVAVFTATGPERWDVAFRFRFRGRPHVYKGTAEGSLSEGELRGEVRNENKRRTFSFRGRFEDGTFRGTHAEVKRYGDRRTGTLTLGG